jgi:SM-20-related protein
VIELSSLLPASTAFPAVREAAFERLLQGLLDSELGLSADFIGERLAHQLKSHLLSLHDQQLMAVAGTGNQQSLALNPSIRKDRIYWLDRSHHNAFEEEFLDGIQAFIAYLNRHCYAGIRSSEFHYALYEPGSFYQRHLDRFSNDDNRQFSLITYLNDCWQEGDGGELVVYQGELAHRIAPTMGQTVFFRSHLLAHQVLATTKLRLSITGWLRRD